MAGLNGTEAQDIFGDTDNKTAPTENGTDEPAMEEDLILKQIRQQCEFYFCDANILKDQFLLNQVKNSADGWIKLEIVEKFKKMQKLSQDHHTVVRALSSSDKLEVSDDGLKVRRRDPLPEWDRSVYYRTIIISDLPEGTFIDHETLNELFEEEKLTPLLIRIFPLNKKIPLDLRRSQTLHPQLGTKLSAVVEFSTKGQAFSAVAVARRRWETAYVHLLSYGSNKTGDMRMKVKKESTDSTGAPPIARRPLLLLKRPEDSARVIHVREPAKPPEENSVGFSPNWRELIRLERLLLNPQCLKSPLDPAALPFVPEIGEVSDTQD